MAQGLNENALDDLIDRVDDLYSGTDWFARHQAFLQEMITQREQALAPRLRDLMTALPLCGADLEWVRLLMRKTQINGAVLDHLACACLVSEPRSDLFRSGPEYYVHETCMDLRDAGFQIDEIADGLTKHFPLDAPG